MWVTGTGMPGIGESIFTLGGGWMALVARRFARAYEGGVEGKARVTVYEAASGEKELKLGGSPAWRNNNPGNLRPSRFHSEQIGEAWGFAVFDDAEAGLRAMEALLKRSGYARLRLQDAIFRYAPPSDSNPSHEYATFVSARSGVGLDEFLGKIGDARLMAVVQAMVVFERSLAGKIRWETT